MSRTTRLNRMILAGLFTMAVGTIQAQQIDLVQPTNPAQCTGDELDIGLTIIGGFNFSNTFTVQLTPGTGAGADFSTADVLPIIGWVPSTGNPPLDTNNAGNKVATVEVPDYLTMGGNYSIRFLSSDPSTISDTIIINVVITPEVAIDSFYGGFDNIFTTDTADWGRCVDDTVVLHATKGNANYQWYINGLEVSIDDPSRAGEDVADSLIVIKPGEYNVTTTAAGCVGSSDTLLINNYEPSPLITLGNPSQQPWIEILDHPTDLTIDSIQFCEEDSILFYGLPPGIPFENYTYQWYKDSISSIGLDSIVPITGETNDTIYITSEIMAGSHIPNYMELYLEVTETYSGCVNVSNMLSGNSLMWPRYIFMDTVPRTDISAVPWPGQSSAPTIICPGDSVRLLADTTGGPDWQYQWEVEFPIGSGIWTALPNDTLPGMVVDTALIPDSARYRLRTNNLTCTHYSNEIEIDVVPLPTFQFLPRDSVTVCIGDSVLVAVTGNGLQYNWSNGFIGSSQYLSVPGTYTVEAVGINQCRTYDSITVYPLIVNANAGPDQTIEPGENAVMAASGGVSYFWYADQPAYFSNPHDPNTLTRPTSDTTKYYVEVTSANGCTGIDSVMIYIRDILEGRPDLSNVTNLITPNGDGFNDVLNLQEVTRGDACELVIMNRWGATVYTDPTYGHDWSGTNDGGDDLSDGTYYFILSCGDEVRFMGPITLIRNQQ